MYDYTIYSRAKHDLEQICSHDRHNDACTQYKDTIVKQWLSFYSVLKHSRIVQALAHLEIKAGMHTQSWFYEHCHLCHAIIYINVT